MSELIEFYEKNRRKILTVIWVIIFCIVGICLINFVRTKNKFMNLETSNTPALVDGFYDSYTFRTNKLDEVEIALISESLIIQPINDDEISIELYGDWKKKNEPKVSCNNGILSIVQKEKRDFVQNVYFTCIKKRRLTRETWDDIMTMYNFKKL